MNERIEELQNRVSQLENQVAAFIGSHHSRGDMVDTKVLTKHLGVSRVTTERWRKAGMPFYRLGGVHVRFYLDEVIEWLEKYKEERTDEN